MLSTQTSSLLQIGFEQGTQVLKVLKNLEFLSLFFAELFWNDGKFSKDALVCDCAFELFIKDRNIAKI